MIQAITFDFWNTLYRGPVNQDVYVRRINDITGVLNDTGCQVTYDQVGSAFKFAWERAFYIQRATGKDPTPRGHIDIALQKLGLVLDDVIVAKVYDVYISTLRSIPPELNKQVKDTLPILAEKYQLAVICNTGATPGIILREIMKNDGIYVYFALLVFSDEITWAKPNPKIFRHTLEGIGVPGINAAHIGDDEITDVIGSKKAGMTSVWLAPDKKWKIPEADFHVRSVDELVGLWK